MDPFIYSILTQFFAGRSDGQMDGGTHGLDGTVVRVVDRNTEGLNGKWTCKGRDRRGSEWTDYRVAGWMQELDKGNVFVFTYN